MESEYVFINTINLQNLWALEFFVCLVRLLKKKRCMHWINVDCERIYKEQL